MQIFLEVTKVIGGYKISGRDPNHGDVTYRDAYCEKHSQVPQRIKDMLKERFEKES